MTWGWRIIAAVLFLAVMAGGNGWVIVAITACLFVINFWIDRRAKAG